MKVDIATANASNEAIDSGAEVGHGRSHVSIFHARHGQVVAIWDYTEFGVSCKVYTAYALRLSGFSVLLEYSKELQDSWQSFLIKLHEVTSLRSPGVQRVQSEEKVAPCSSWLKRGQCRGHS